MNALLPAVVAGIAAWLLLRAPAHALRRLEPPRALPLPRFLAARPGAPPLRQRVMVGLAAALVIALLIDDALGLLVGALAGGAVVLAVGRTGQRPDHAALLRELPDALDFLAVCLDAGLPMSRCLDLVAEVSPPKTREVLALAAGQLRIGRAGELAWRELSTHPVWGAVAGDIARAERTGTALAAVLRTHAQDARQERREAALKRARTVGVKSVVPLMACFLPAFVLVGVVPIVLGLVGGFFG